MNPNDDVENTHEPLTGAAIDDSFVPPAEGADSAQAEPVAAESSAAEPGADGVDDEPAEEHKNLFDIIGDFFYRMVKGIFIFAFWKLPKLIWKIVFNIEFIKRCLKYAKSIVRAIFWGVLWVAIVFAAWMAFGWQKFVDFWTAVGNWLWHVLLHIGVFFANNFGVIWMVVALMGSVYGLIFVTLRRRKKRRLKQAESQAKGQGGQA
ncbi:MAG: hypothetical protein ILO10_01725 [Kiritimatiellae bacterium]|nr:hypothetical protein [Kiritimatiellia bacterium]